MGFVGFENPQTASMVNVFIALAPVGWVYHSGRYSSPLFPLFPLSLIFCPPPLIFPFHNSVLLKALADLDAQVYFFSNRLAII